MLGIELMTNKNKGQIPPSEVKQKALEVALEAIKKSQGAGAVMMGEECIPNVEFFSSGCVSIDKILGGGWAKGRIIEIFGPESTGKTTIALHAIAEAQKVGGRAAFIDAEHALDIVYADALGVDTSQLLISQPDNGEQALDITEALARSNAVDLIVIDSVAALVPKTEIEGNMGDSTMGSQARLMSQAMRKLVGVCYNTNCTIIFINQLRMKIGVMFGSPETTTGGNALKFYATQRLDIRRIGGTKEGEEIVANRTRVKCVKNKVAPPFRECEVEIRFGEGLDVYADLLDRAVEAKLLEKAGSWYSYKGNQVGQGAGQARLWLIQNPEVSKEISKQILSK